MFFLSAQIRIEIPGLPSGVSCRERVRSIPASQGHPIRDVANPVASTAAVYAHSGVAAVMMTRESQTGNASAKVSSIVVPLISTAYSPVRIHYAILGYDSVHRDIILIDRQAVHLLAGKCDPDLPQVWIF